MEENFSAEVLEGVTVRVTRFLTGLGRSALARSTLAHYGLTREIVERGQTLLLRALAVPLPVLPASPEQHPDYRRKRAAGVEVNAWDEDNFAQARANLAGHFPELVAYVFQGVESSTREEEAITMVGTFLARLNALENGTDAARQGSRTRDREAIEYLHRHGITREERARIEGLVKLATGDAPVVEVELGDITERRQALVELKLWYDEWAATARARIKKRRVLIQLGLARLRGRGPRREGADDEGELELDEPGAAAPAGPGGDAEPAAVPTTGSATARGRGRP